MQLNSCKLDNLEVDIDSGRRKGWSMSAHHPDQRRAAPRQRSPTCELRSAKLEAPDGFNEEQLH